MNWLKRFPDQYQVDEGSKYFCCFGGNLTQGVEEIVFIETITSIEELPEIKSINR